MLEEGLSDSRRGKTRPRFGNRGYTHRTPVAAIPRSRLSPGRRDATVHRGSIMKQSPIFVRTYDLLQWLLHATENYPRSQRFVLARRIQDAAFDLQEALLAAGAQSGSARQESLHRADLHLSKLRLYMRLSLDLGWLQLGQYEHVARMMDEVGKLLGGWLGKERERQA